MPNLMLYIYMYIYIRNCSEQMTLKNHTLKIWRKGLLGNFSTLTSTLNPSRNFHYFPTQILKTYWGQLFNFIFWTFCGLAFQNFKDTSLNFKGGSSQHCEGNKVRILKKFGSYAQFWSLSTKNFEDPPFVIVLGALGLQGASNLWVWRWGCPNTRLCTLFASFRWKTHKPPFWNQGFLPCLAEKATFNDKSASLPQKCVWNYLQPSFRPIWAKKLRKRQFLPKNAPATSCDVLWRFLRRLRRFLRRPATFSATPCDVFWQLLVDFVIFGHVLPIFWKIRENVPKFQVSRLVFPRFA